MDVPKGQIRDEGEGVVALLDIVHLEIKAQVVTTGFAVRCWRHERAIQRAVNFHLQTTAGIVTWYGGILTTFQKKITVSFCGVVGSTDTRLSNAFHCAKVSAWMPAKVFVALI